MASLVTVPSLWAVSGCSIFIASRITTGSPAETRWPSPATILTMVPCIGLVRVSPSPRPAPDRADRRARPAVPPGPAGRGAAGAPPAPRPAGPGGAASRARRSARPGGGRGDGDTLTSPMQGTIVKIVAGEGQRVSAGDPIVILEAMKMEQPLTAHKDGTVTGLTVKVGQTVAAGEALCRLKD